MLRPSWLLAGSMAFRGSRPLAGGAPVLPGAVHLDAHRRLPPSLTQPWRAAQPAGPGRCAVLGLHHGVPHRHGRTHRPGSWPTYVSPSHGPWACASGGVHTVATPSRWRSTPLLEITLVYALLAGRPPPPWHPRLKRWLGTSHLPQHPSCPHDVVHYVQSLQDLLQPVLRLQGWPDPPPRLHRRCPVVRLGLSLVAWRPGPPTQGSLTEQSRAPCLAVSQCTATSAGCLSLWPCGSGGAPHP